MLKDNFVFFIKDNFVFKPLTLKNHLSSVKKNNSKYKVRNRDAPDYYKSTKQLADEEVQRVV